MTIPAFPKIFALGTKYIQDIFDGPVEITEKVDGSQFCFGKTEDGELHIRSKGATLYADVPQGMFQDGIDYIVSIKDKIPNNRIFYAEYLQKPKHNTLKYENTPKNHIALFGAFDPISQVFFSSDTLHEYAEYFRVDSVPVIYKGEFSSTEVLPLLDLNSYLGGCKIEGVVVKNYAKTLVLGGAIVPIMAGKFVSEAFKEVHQHNWKENTGKSRMETFVESFRTEARWEKAIQHLKESGKLLEEPKDIGPLIKEIGDDIQEEEAEAIKEFLFKEYIPQIRRRAVAGFPEYYKEKLLNGN